MSGKKVLLAILDGWGIENNPKISAVAAANTPFMDKATAENPNNTLVTYGEEVGLPEGQMGNSEVGHLNIGAGRIVYQDFAKINKSIREGDFFENRILTEAFEKAKNQPQAKVHLLGLLSDGGVHSHINHLKALCKMGDSYGVSTNIHAFMDGRDTAPNGGQGYVEDLLAYIKPMKTVALATMIGRYYAMDRDLRWERVKKSYDLMVHGVGTPTTDFVESLSNSYENGITDEFVEPLVNKSLKENSNIKEGDIVIFFNFRTDRPRQITRALTQESFPDFEMKPIDLHFVCMTQYSAAFKNLKVAYEKPTMVNTLGDVLSANGKTQLRAAETEKYPHVTFFFNGGVEKEIEGEFRALSNSPKVATYDLQPEMSAPDVTKSILKSIEEQSPDFICVNYANADMVGHTGVFDAVIKSVETVDDALSQLVPVAQSDGYQVIIIADHGNADIMVNADGSIHTAHTTNPVPVIFMNDLGVEEINAGKLADIAPTVLKIMNIEQPSEMDGVPLF